VEAARPTPTYQDKPGVPYRLPSNDPGDHPPAYAGPAGGDWYRSSYDPHRGSSLPYLYPVAG